MSDQSASVDLVRLIHRYFRRVDQSASGVSEVVAGIDRHLANPGQRVKGKPAVPREREGLLDRSIESVTKPGLQSLGSALGRLRDQLTWRIDDGLFYPPDANVGEGYLNGNLHTELIGPDGCVFRDEEFSLGIFMLAPATLYRDHDHAAPELYLNLTGPCGWRFDRGSWRDFSAGSIVWNPDGRVHAMRTYEQPFLSVYSWTANVKSRCRVLPMDDWQDIEAQLANSQTNK